MAEERARVYAPLERSEGLDSREFEHVVTEITTRHFGPIKSEHSLTTALAKLSELDGHWPRFKAANLHELMKCHEAMNVQQCAKITANAALARRESRVPPYHYRSDYPETNDGEYCGLIVVRRNPDGSVGTRFEALDYSGYL